MDDEDELDIEKEEQFEIGNRNRALWKKIGRSVASNVRPRFFVLLYLCPHLVWTSPLCLPPVADLHSFFFLSCPNPPSHRRNSPFTSELSTELSQDTSLLFFPSVEVGRITSGRISTLGLRLGPYPYFSSLTFILPTADPSPFRRADFPFFRFDETGSIDVFRSLVDSGLKSLELLSLGMERERERELEEGWRTCFSRS